MTHGLAHPAPNPGERIDIPSVANLRDVGGYPVAGGGAVRTGLLYRSAGLGRITAEDSSAFAALGLKTVFDLRTDPEREMAPDRVPEGTALIALDVLGDHRAAAPARLQGVFEDPARAPELFGDGRAEDGLREAYRDIVLLPSAQTAYRGYFSRLLADGTMPALVHCTAGKDRTGWAVASTLLLAGVSEDDVMADYVLSNRDLIPALAPLFEAFEERGGDPEVIRPIFSVAPEYLEIALATVHTSYGSIETYFADGLGIDADAQRALRELLVVA
ncbi:MAG: tyrosine-protein phosphatase [Solirubrobacteraceae bacterium]|nr:tyrosine-protein phosphatase [Solirubrobacteraceae bacterium]